MRNKKNILLLMLIALCIVVFLGYRMLDRIRTDSRPPEIAVDSSPLEISMADPQEALLAGVTATDKQDGNVSDSLIVEKVSILDHTGRLSVSYAAFDESGNVAKAQREARYTDYTAPRFTLQTPLLYRYGSTFDILSTVGATDIVDGNIQHRIRATAMDNTAISAMGIHDVQFQVSNSLGDTVTLVLPVEVYDPQAYDADLKLNQYLVYLGTGDSFRAEDYLDSFTCSSKSATLDGSLPRDFSLKTVGTVQTDTAGVYPVEYRVTYTERNELNPYANREFTGYSKLIVVVEG